MGNTRKLNRVTRAGITASGVAGGLAAGTYYNKDLAEAYKKHPKSFLGGTALGVGLYAGNELRKEMDPENKLGSEALKRMQDTKRKLASKLNLLAEDEKEEDEKEKEKKNENKCYIYVCDQNNSAFCTIISNTKRGAENIIRKKPDFFTKCLIGDQTFTKDTLAHFISNIAGAFISFSNISLPHWYKNSMISFKFISFVSPETFSKKGYVLDVREIRDAQILFRISIQEKFIKSSIQIVVRNDKLKWDRCLLNGEYIREEQVDEIQKQIMTICNEQEFKGNLEIKLETQEKDKDGNEVKLLRFNSEVELGIGTY